MEFYKNRLYIKFKAEEDWKQFLNTVKLESFRDNQEHTLTEFMDYFPGSFDTDFYQGIRISREDLDVLFYDESSEAIKAFIEGFASIFESRGTQAILLADRYHYTHSPGNSREYWYLGQKLHELYRTEEAEVTAKEHYKIDISDCRKWLEEDRVDSLRWTEYELLEDIGSPRKSNISSEEKAVLKRIHKNDAKKTLNDIFPNMDRGLGHQLVIENGVLTDWEPQDEYLGIDIIPPDEDFNNQECISWLLPAEVTEIGDQSGMFCDSVRGNGMDTLVFTTNLKTLNPKHFGNSGFKHVYIIDPDTEEVLFHSEKFCNKGEHEWLRDDKLWIEFTKRYNEWPAVAMANPWFYSPEVNDQFEAMDWVDYLERLWETQENTGEESTPVTEEKEESFETVEEAEAVETEEIPSAAEETTEDFVDDEVKEEEEESLEDEDPSDSDEEDEPYETEESLDEEEEEEWMDDDEDDDEDYESEEISSDSTYYWITEEKERPNEKADVQPEKKKSFWSIFTREKPSMEADHSLDGTYKIDHILDRDTTDDYKPVEMGAEGSILTLNGDRFELELNWKDKKYASKVSGTFTVKKGEQMTFYVNRFKFATGSTYRGLRLCIYVGIRKLSKYLIVFESYR